MEFNSEEIAEHRYEDEIFKDDVIWRKTKLKEVFLKDEAIKKALNRPNPKPNIKFVDKDNPTDAELQEQEAVEEYNEKILGPQIIDYIKLDDLQTQVMNFIMFDFLTERASYVSDTVLVQYVDIFVVVHEDDMGTNILKDTKYASMLEDPKSLLRPSVNRCDWLAYLVKDLLNQSSVLNKRMYLYSDYPKILDNHYYAREMRFKIDALNTNRTGRTLGNYDHLTNL